MTVERPETPPRTRAHDGGPRKIGVELEFAARDAGAGAGIVQHLFGDISAPR
jgi:hypothetical protein